jgi:hypothetical protein
MDWPVVGLVATSLVGILLLLVGAPAFVAVVGLSARALANPGKLRTVDRDAAAGHVQCEFREPGDGYIYAVGPAHLFKRDGFLAVKADGGYKIVRILRVFPESDGGHGANMAWAWFCDASEKLDWSAEIKGTVVAVLEPLQWFAIPVLGMLLLLLLWSLLACVGINSPLIPLIGGPLCLILALNIVRSIVAIPGD